MPRDPEPLIGLAELEDILTEWWAALSTGGPIDPELAGDWVFAKRQEEKAIARIGHGFAALIEEIAHDPALASAAEVRRRRDRRQAGGDGRCRPADPIPTRGRNHPAA